MPEEESSEIKVELDSIIRHCMSDMNNIGKVKMGETGQYRSVLVGQGLAIF